MELLHFLENLRFPFLNSLMLIITELGDETVAIVILCLTYWCINKNVAMKAALTYFFSGLFTHGIKVTARIERPWVLDETLTPLEAAVGTTGGSYSFPSGHTQSVTGLFMPLAMNSKKAFKWIFSAVIILVAFSRLYFGVHTLADVLVGFLIAAVCAVIINIYFERLEKAYMTTGLVLAGVAVAVGIYVLILYNKGILTLHTTESICKAVGAGLGYAVGWIIEHRFVNFETKCNKLWHQAVKFIVGIGLTVGIKSGLKPIIGDSLVADTFRYFLIVLFAIAIYPLIFKKIQAKK